MDVYNLMNVLSLSKDENTMDNITNQDTAVTSEQHNILSSLSSSTNMVLSDYNEFKSP